MTEGTVEIKQEVKTAKPVVPNITIEDITDLENDRLYQFMWKQHTGPDYPRLKYQIDEKVRAFGTAVFKVYDKQLKAKMREYRQAAVLEGANETMFADQPLDLACGSYVCDDNGIHTLNRDGENVEVLSHPLMPVRRITDVERGTERLEIAYKRGEDDWKTILDDVTEFAKKQSIVKFANYGISVTSENADKLVKYIQYMKDVNYERIPVTKGISHLGWVDGHTFSPYIEDTVYNGTNEEMRSMFSAFKPHGSFDKWMKMAKEVRNGKSLPCRIALDCGFAAPLMKVLNALTAIVHFYGVSGMGKSVAMMLAASVWAEPTVGGAYVRSMSSTQVGIEHVCGMCGNVPVLLDEAQSYPGFKAGSNADPLIYMITEGVSKGRGAKDGGMREREQWQTIVMTNGEMPLVTSSSGGGAVARVICVDNGGIHYFRNARVSSAIMKENYGFAGKLFVEKLTETLAEEGGRERIRKINGGYIDELEKYGIHSKQVGSAAAILTGSHLADEWVFHDGKRLTVADLLPSLVTNEAVDPGSRAYIWLMEKTAGNPTRFEKENQDTEDAPRTEVWGRLEQRNLHGSNKPSDVVCFLPAMLDDLLAEKGFDKNALVDWCKRNGFLVYDNGRGNQTRTTIFGKQRGVYGFEISAASQVKELTEAAKVRKAFGAGAVETEEEEMPF